MVKRNITFPIIPILIELRQQSRTPRDGKQLAEDKPNRWFWEILIGLSQEPHYGDEHLGFQVGPSVADTLAACCNACRHLCKLLRRLVPWPTKWRLFRIHWTVSSKMVWFFHTAKPTCLCLLTQCWTQVSYMIGIFHLTESTLVQIPPLIPSVIIIVLPCRLCVIFWLILNTAIIKYHAFGLQVSANFRRLCLGPCLRLLAELSPLPLPKRGFLSFLSFFVPFLGMW